MINTIIQMFSYNFILRALIVGVLISLCSSLLGVTLVLKRYSMIGDGLSHVGFGALAVATALGMSPLAVTVPVVVIAAFFLLRLNETAKIKGDAAIAMISTGALAFGVITVSVSTGLNSDLYSYLFGSILAMSKNDVYFSIVLSVIVLSVYILFYNKIFAVTFDEAFAKATGVSVNMFNSLIAVLTAVTVVLGMRMMGSMLISALIIFPSLTSMRIFKTFKSVAVSSACLSVVCFAIGMYISFVYNLPTGASIVAVNIIMFIIYSAVSKIKTKL